MNRILPYLPLTKPISAIDDARQFDAAVFDQHLDLFTYAPAAVCNAGRAARRGQRARCRALWSKSRSERPTWNS